MRTKQQIQDRLINDSLYNAALTSVEPEEREKIKQIVGSMFVDLALQIDQFAEAIVADPAAMQELRKGLSMDRNVITSELIISSSVG